MTRFTDALGREWSIDLTIGSARALKDGPMSIDLCRLNEGEPSLGRRLVTDAVLFADVLADLTAPARKQDGLTAEQFQAALDGPALIRASDAFWAEMNRFFLAWNPTMMRDVWVGMAAQTAATPSPTTPGPSLPAGPASAASAPTDSVRAN